jgi:hypothetical protein
VAGLGSLAVRRNRWRNPWCLGYTLAANFTGGTISNILSTDISGERDSFANVGISGTVDIDWLNLRAPGQCEISGGTFRKVETTASGTNCRITGANAIQEVVVGPESTVTVRGYNLVRALYAVTGEWEDLGAFSFEIPVVTGTLILDEIPQIIDTDGDGVPDDEDAFPNDPTETADSDSDGFGDNSDEFPNSITDPTIEFGTVTIDNEHIANGAWLADEIDFALRTDLSTADLVAYLVALKDEGLITGREMGQIIREHNTN